MQSQHTNIFNCDPKFEVMTPSRFKMYERGEEYFSAKNHHFPKSIISEQIGFRCDIEVQNFISSISF